MKRAVYPGSFDPLTLGHLDLIQTAASLFDTLTVSVLVNPDKRPWFTGEERMELITQAVSHIPNVQVDKFEGLLVDYVRQQGFHVVIRGVREISDFETEMKLAHMNRTMEPSVVTIFLPTRPEHGFVSSSLVKQVASYGGDVTPFVPATVAQALEAKVRKP